MARPANPHPAFPVGAAVRVLAMHATASRDKQRLAGRTGTVVYSSRSAIQVEFPGEPFRQFFSPHHLEQVSGPGRGPE